MAYVIYNKETTKILSIPARSVRCYVESYKTESAAKAALTRQAKKGALGAKVEYEPCVYPNGMEGTKKIETPYTKEDFAISEARAFYASIEKVEKKRNLMSGEEFEQGVNTHACVDPSTETYWSM